MEKQGGSYTKGIYSWSKSLISLGQKVVGRQ